MLNRILAIIHIMLLDGIRRHALLGLFTLGILAEFSGLLFIDFFGRDIGRAAADYAFSIMWLIGLLFLFFHAVHAIAWDEDRKSIYVLLSRPISRTEYVLGIFSGLGLLLCILQTMLAASALGALYLIQDSVAEVYFQTLSIPSFLISYLGLLIMQLCLLAVIVLFSGILRGGFLVTMVSLAYYAISSGLPIVRTFFTEPQTIMLALLKVLTFIFPNYSRLDFKSDITNSNTFIMPYGELMLSLSYLLLVLCLACYIYQKRAIY